MSPNEFALTLERWHRAAYCALKAPATDVANLMLYFVSRKRFKADGSVQCWPAIDTMAQILDKHRVNVQRTVSKLAADGVVSISKDGRHNVYTFEPGWLADVERKRGQHWDQWPNKSLDQSRGVPKDRGTPSHRRPPQPPQRGSTAGPLRPPASAVNGDKGFAARIERTVNGKRNMADAGTDAEGEYCRTDIKRIDLGKKIRNPGAVLRQQFREMVKEGFSAAVILRARDGLVDKAKHEGKRVYVSRDVLRQACEMWADADV
jgi:hypothetical protein